MNRKAVEPSWRTYFDEALGVTPEPEPPPVTVIVNEAPPEPVAPDLTDDRPSLARREAPPASDPAGDRPTLARRDVPAAPVAGRSKAVARTSILPGDILQPIRGGAIRIVENMEASLTVPTATSVRTMPVRTVEENRLLLNKHRKASGQGKISFTHLVAWAILRALETFPRLNDAYAEVDGESHRIQRDQVRLGIAVDVQRKDGSRTLLVPNIKDAQAMDFAELVRAFDDLIGRSRKGAISPDDFMGTTVSLTNPGTVGTTSSAPRLMPGQGLIVATGSLDYPAEYRSMAPKTLGAPRHQQGDDGELDLRPPHHPGGGVRALPGAHGGPAQGRGRLLRAPLRRPRAAPPAGALGDGLRAGPPRRSGEPRGGREAGQGPAAHPRLPGPRPPRGRPRPPRPSPRARIGISTPPPTA